MRQPPLDPDVADEAPDAATLRELVRHLATVSSSGHKTVGVLRVTSWQLRQSIIRSFRR
jgi:hypothetical protein